MRRRLHLDAVAAAAPLLLLLHLLLPLAAAATAAAPPPPSPPNVTAAMSKGGCKAFADLIAASPDAASTYASAVAGGITVFCPTDDAVRAFLPKYKNLTADGKAELLLFHAVPVYYSKGSLKSNNGVMNTLATDGAAKNYNFTVQNEGEAVTIKTAASATVARVKYTVVDSDPVAIFAVDEVIEPVELFKPAPAPTPAPSPAPAAADAPKGSSSKPAHHPAPVVADAPGPAATDSSPPADQKKEAKKSAAAAPPSRVVRWLAAAFAVVAVASTLG